MDIKEAILRAHECKLSQSTTAYILGITPEQVRLALAAEGRTYYGRPSNVPSAYYKDRLAQGYTVMDITKELHCTRSSIYKVLQQRDIDIHHYTAVQQQRKEAPNVHTNIT